MIKYKLVENLYNARKDKELPITDEELEDETEGVPKEILQMISSGLEPKDIVSLCRTDKRLNEAVCNNQNFYRMLGRRDYENWSFALAPSAILPIEKSTRNHKWLNGPAVYWGSPMLPKFWISAYMPGTGHTVKMHDTDYIWYYFSWAPKDNKLVNYNKKFTDEEIIKDIREGQKIEHEKDYRKGNAIFGLSNKRKNMMLLNMGIVNGKPGKPQIPLDEIPRLSKLKLDSEKKMQEQGIINSLFNVFKDATEPRFFPDKLFYPRTWKDLSLEYDRFPEDVSLAFLVAMKKGGKKEYGQLLNKYNIMEQLDEMEDKLRNSDDYWSLDHLERLINTLLEAHELDNLKFENTEITFPNSDSYWPDYFNDRLVKLRNMLNVKLSDR